MKKQIAVMMTAAAMLVGSSLPAAAANVRVKVPFDFEAGRTKLPAGTYEVEKGANGGFIAVWNVEQNKTVLLNTMPIGNPNAEKPAALVFERTSGGYRLAEVRMAGSRPVGIPATKAQSLVAQEQGRATMVEVAMVR